LPKDENSIEKDIKKLNSNYKEKYHASEIGIFYKIIDGLKLTSQDEERRYLSVFNFIM